MTTKKGNDFLAAMLGKRTLPMQSDERIATEPEKPRKKLSKGAHYMLHMLDEDADGDPIPEGMAVDEYGQAAPFVPTPQPREPLPAWTLGTLDVANEDVHGNEIPDGMELDWYGEIVPIDQGWHRTPSPDEESR